MNPDRSQAVYEKSGVADFYAAHEGLQPAEERLFDAYVQPDLRVLDLGVGGGRTTPRLSREAALYVGADYSEAMVARCRQRFPDLRFEVADATRMPIFPDGSFDVVVFSFNGIDTIPTREGRRDGLRECARVLRPGGVFILSVHNARHLLFPPTFGGARGLHLAWRVAYAVLRSLQLLALRLPGRAFRHGSGYMADPGTHGGLRVYGATPARQTAELEAAGFDVERVLAAPRPEQRCVLAIGWYYYACRKRHAIPESA